MRLLMVGNPDAFLLSHAIGLMTMAASYTAAGGPANFFQKNQGFKLTKRFLSMYNNLY